MYYHFSSHPFHLKSKNYQQGTYKPNGFWLSIENSWIDYIGYHYKHKTQIEIINLEKIIFIHNLEQATSFKNKYFSKGEFFRGEDGINWQEVTKDYDGFILLDFQFLDNLFENPISHKEFGWLMDFDCSSGCIWNLEILRISPNKKS